MKLQSNCGDCCVSQGPKVPLLGNKPHRIPIITRLQKRGVKLGNRHMLIRCEIHCGGGILIVEIGAGIATRVQRYPTNLCCVFMTAAKHLWISVCKQVTHLC